MRKCALLILLFVFITGCSTARDSIVAPSTMPTVTLSVEPSSEPSTELAQVYYMIGDEKHLIFDTELTVRAPEEMALLGEFYQLESLIIETDSLDGFDLSTLGKVGTLRLLSLSVGTPDGTSLYIPRIDTIESLTVSGNIAELRVEGGEALSRLSFTDGSVGSAEVDYAPMLATVENRSDIGSLTINEGGASVALFAYRPIDAFEYDGALSATIYTDGFDLSVLTANNLRFLQIADWYDYDLAPLEGIELADGLTLRVEDQENETISVPKDSELLPSNSTVERKKASLVSVHSAEELGRTSVNIYPPDALYALETDFDKNNLDVLAEYVRQGGTIVLGSRYNSQQGLNLSD